MLCCDLTPALVSACLVALARASMWGCFGGGLLETQKEPMPGAPGGLGQLMSRRSSPRGHAALSLAVSLPFVTLVPPLSSTWGPGPRTELNAESLRSCSAGRSGSRKMSRSGMRTRC